MFETLIIKIAKTVIRPNKLEPTCISIDLIIWSKGKNPTLKFPIKLIMKLKVKKTISQSFHCASIFADDEKLKDIKRNPEYLSIRFFNIKIVCSFMLSELRNSKLVEQMIDEQQLKY